MCFRIISKDADQASDKTGAAKREVDQAFIAAAEAAQQADQAAFARFVTRWSQWRADLQKKTGEPVS